MKKTILTLLSVLFCAITFAQNVPQGINYQAIARDAAGAELANDTLAVQFSIITSGSVSWQENHTVTTNDFGLFTAIIGNGTTTNGGSSITFDLIDWGAAAHSLKVEIDYGNGYLDMGTNDFMSVPYSLHAKTAANGSTTDELQSLRLSGDTLFIEIQGSVNSGNWIILTTPILLGCTDLLYTEYNPLANTNDGSCATLIVNGCTGSTAFNYNALANTDDGSCAYAIGDNYQGGIIFYIFQLGDAGYVAGQVHGLIAAPTDQSTDAEWGCNGTNITGADAVGIGTGAQNTIDIVNANCSPYNSVNPIAANICDTLTLGGYSDWFLPSKDELNAMYSNIGQGNVLGLGTNVGGFPYIHYWSSSEFIYSTYKVWIQRFGEGGTQTTSGKTNQTMFHVRAVRAF